MTTLDRGTDTWNGSLTQNTTTKTYVLSTANKYVDKDISLNVSMPGVVLSAPSSGSETFYVNIGDTTYQFTTDSDGNVETTTVDDAYKTLVDSEDNTIIFSNNNLAVDNWSGEYNQSSIFV